MKKLFALAFATALALSLSMMSFAASEPIPGDIYTKNDDDNYIGAPYSGDLVPGVTYYVAISSGASGAAKPASKATVSYICTSISSDKKFSIMGNSLQVAKRKYSAHNTDYYYFAEMKLKDIPVSSYSEDGYSLEITSLKCGSDTIMQSRGFTVSYPEASSTIGDTPSLLILEDTTEEYYMGDTNGTVTIDSQGRKTKILMSFDNKYNQDIGNKYANANLEFLNFKSAALAKNATVVIPVDSSYRYLYDLSGGGLTEITSKNSAGDFQFKTKTLGTFILSDARISGAGIPSSSSDSNYPPVSIPGGTPTYPTYPSLPGSPTGGYLPFNPGTGAAV